MKKKNDGFQKSLYTHIGKAICAVDAQDWDELSKTYNGRQRQLDYKRFAETASKAYVEFLT